MRSEMKVRKIDIMVWVAFILIMIHLYAYKPLNVFWEVYYKFIFSGIIISFSLNNGLKRGTNIIGVFTMLGLASYIAAPMMIRLYLAIEFFDNYKKYRAAVEGGGYNIPLMAWTLIILLIVYMAKVYYERRQGIIKTNK